MVCAGVKSILDVAGDHRTARDAERGRARLSHRPVPRFLPRRLRLRLHWRVESPAEAADGAGAAPGAGYRRLRHLLANPVSAGAELDADLHDRVLAAGLAALDRHGVAGKDVTPFLLEHFHRETHGASLATNIALVLSNARLGAEVAVELSRRLSANAGSSGEGPGPGSPTSPPRARSRPAGDGTWSAWVTHGRRRRLPARRAAARLGSARAHHRAGRRRRGQHRLLAGRGRGRGRHDGTGRARPVRGLDGRGPHQSRRCGRLVRDSTHPTGTCIVLVAPDGERTMVPDAGANAAMPPPTCRRPLSRPVGTCTCPVTPCSVGPGPPVCTRWNWPAPRG